MRSLGSPRNEVNFALSLTPEVPYYLVPKVL